MSESLINTIALNCNDPQFTDFKKSIYSEKLYRVDRHLSKTYAILRKILNFKLGDYLTSDNLNSDIELNLPGFKAEYLVDVNGITMLRGGVKLTNINSYYLEQRGETYNFNYIKDNTISFDPSITYMESYSVLEKMEVEENKATNYGKAISDEITICYYILPEENSEIGQYVIPIKYEEERINRTCVEMAKLGIVKFSGSEKKRQYQEILQLYSDPLNEFDKRNLMNDGFVQVQPYIIY